MAQRFVCEIPLRNPPRIIEKTLMDRFDFARIAYNHCVTELNRRYALMNESREARQLRAETKRAKTGKSASGNPVIVDCETAKERSALWRALYSTYEIDGEYCLADFVAQFRRNNQDRVGANAVPVTILHESAGARAWRAFEPFLFHKPSGNGFRGQPRRRPWTKPFTTLTTRSTEKNHGPIQFHGDTVTFSNGLAGAKRNILTLRTMINLRDPVIYHALGIIFDTAKDDKGKVIDRICQLRLGYRDIKMQRRWFVQLVLDGLPLRKPVPRIADGPVGVTIGVRHLAIVAPALNLTRLLVLDDYISVKMQDDQKLEVLRARSQDRSRRMMNPDAFDEKGQYIKGQRARNRSKAYQRLGQERREYNRIVNERKKTHRNTFANTLIRLGSSIHIADLPYAKWQIKRGKAMLGSTPAAFAEAVARVTVKHGIDLVMIDSRKAKMMQRCHACGKLSKRQPNKPVVSRMSDCECGRQPMQQHVYASFLASQSAEDGTLNPQTLEKDWLAIQGETTRQDVMPSLLEN